jgi:hypothetical protein
MDTEGYNFDRFSGKELDREIDAEEGLDEISSEDLAADYKRFCLKLSSKLPPEFNQELENIISNIEFYYDPKVEGDWKEDVFEPLDDLIDKLELASADEIETDEDEYADEISEILKATVDLKKNKVN